MKVICDSIGSTELCQGCGAAKPHNPTHCEPCPVNKAAKCKEADVKNVAGVFLQQRNIFFDSNGKAIDFKTTYDLFKTSDKYIVIKSNEQPYCLLFGHIHSDSDKGAMRLCLRCEKYIYGA